jgi:hypothetical protein
MPHTIYALATAGARHMAAAAVAIVRVSGPAAFDTLQLMTDRGRRRLPFMPRCLYLVAMCPPAVLSEILGASEQFSNVIAMGRIARLVPYIIAASDHGGTT